METLTAGVQLAEFADSKRPFVHHERMWDRQVYVSAPFRLSCSLVDRVDHVDHVV